MTMTTARFIVSEMAAERIKVIAGEKAGLRVAVDGGGCSGFQYSFALADAVEQDDLVFESNGAKVFVDPTSITFMEGAVLDFVDDLMGQSFRVKNPLVKAACGCGTSFSI